MSVKIKDELELIGERADRIGGLARDYAAGRAADGEDLYDTLRDVAGVLQLAIVYLEVAEERAEGDRPYEPAPGVEPPPWASEG